jgi:hypothetical protein
MGFRVVVVKAGLESGFIPGHRGGGIIPADPGREPESISPWHPGYPLPAG